MTVTFETIHDALDRVRENGGEPREIQMNPLDLPEFIRSLYPQERYPQERFNRSGTIHVVGLPIFSNELVPRGKVYVVGREMVP